MSCSNSSYNMFQEAISHCRWKTVLHNFLTNCDINQFQNKSFDDIFVTIYNMCKNIKGLGVLTVYDITSATCRRYNIVIDKVFIIGSGPKRAIKLLHIKPTIYNVSKKINIYYVSISDVIMAFDKEGFKLENEIRCCTNGDIIETFICNWQKSIS